MKVASVHYSARRKSHKKERCDLTLLFNDSSILRPSEAREIWIELRSFRVQIVSTKTNHKSQYGQVIEDQHKPYEVFRTILIEDWSLWFFVRFKIKEHRFRWFIKHRVISYKWGEYLCKNGSYYIFFVYFQALRNTDGGYNTEIVHSKPWK